MYECHGDFFDAWDDHMAAQEGYRNEPQSSMWDCEDERQRNIRATSIFNRSVAALEEARIMAEVAI